MFVVKEKEYFTAENAEDAEKRPLLFKRHRQYYGEGRKGRRSDIRYQRSKVGERQRSEIGGVSGGVL